MSLELKGTLHNVLGAESGTSKAGKEWIKQSFVIDTGAQFNPLVCFSLFGKDKINLINDLKLGDTITVSFNLSSREYKEKYYHSVDAWKIETAKTEVVIEEDIPF